MKKHVLFLAMMFVTFFASAQQMGNNAFKINPLSLALRTGNVAYERALGANKSFQLGVFYSGVQLGDLKYQGYGVTPEVRFYLNRSSEPLNGMYLAPFARYQNFEIGTKGADSKAQFYTVGGGATFGWQKTWEGGFLLNVFAGPSYNSINFRHKNADDDFDINGGISGFGLRTGIALGFSF